MRQHLGTVVCSISEFFHMFAELRSPPTPTVNIFIVSLRKFIQARAQRRKNIVIEVANYIVHRGVFMVRRNVLNSST